MYYAYRKKICLGIVAILASLSFAAGPAFRGEKGTAFGRA
jgi:hypothetical protein